MINTIEKLRKLGNCLRLYVIWFFVKPKKVWITLLPFGIGAILIWLVPVGIFNVTILCDTLETRFRFGGLFLESLGIGAVVWGLNKDLWNFEGKHLPDIIP